MVTWKIGLGFVASWALLTCGQIASAGLIGLNQNTNQLVSIDTTTGVGTLIASMPNSNPVTAIALREDGVMFGVFGGHGFNDFLRIDPSTGEYTVIGSTGRFLISSLAFGPNGELFGADQANHELLKIDTTTGTATTLGTVGHTLHSLAFRDDGQLFGTKYTRN